MPACVLLCTLALCAAAAAAAAPPRGGFGTVGLYVWKDTPDQHAFWKACGIDTLQLCDTHWSIRADLLDDYYQRLAADVARVRRSGFRVNVILFSNIEQWAGPQEREPRGTGVLLDPRDPAALERRLASIARAVRALKKAHGFTLLAGDPGGAVGAPFGPLPAEAWMEMARRVREVVRREAPGAYFNVNPWAIAYWQYPHLGCGGAEWWVREGELTRAVLAEPGLIGPDCGVELPAHNYYRAMALRTQAQEGVTPSLLPTRADVEALRQRGAPRVWAWPYFLLDEADDGDVGPDGRIVPGVQIETRYIHRLVSRMRAVGMDGVIGNWSYAGYLDKALNTYAFGRFCRDEAATPEGVIDEWARCIATQATWRPLAQVLRFIEGESNWQRKLPESSRLPALPCELRDAAEALAALETVRARTRPRFALAEAPGAYLDRLRRRLERLTARPRPPKASGGGGLVAPPARAAAGPAPADAVSFPLPFPGGGLGWGPTASVGRTLSALVGSPDLPLHPRGKGGETGRHSPPAAAVPARTAEGDHKGRPYARCGYLLSGTPSPFQGEGRVGSVWCLWHHVWPIAASPDLALPPPWQEGETGRHSPPAAAADCGSREAAPGTASRGACRAGHGGGAW